MIAAQKARSSVSIGYCTQLISPTNKGATGRYSQGQKLLSMASRRGCFPLKHRRWR